MFVAVYSRYLLDVFSGFNFYNYWIISAVKDTEICGYCNLSGSEKMLDVFGILEQVPFEMFSAS
jgi:hypothetical protein